MVDYNATYTVGMGDAFRTHEIHLNKRGIVALAYSSITSTVKSARSHWRRKGRFASARFPSIPSPVRDPRLFQGFPKVVGRVDRCSAMSM
jgi:hypothetical protein